MVAMVGVVVLFILKLPKMSKAWLILILGSIILQKMVAMEKASSVVVKTEPISP